MPPRKKQKLSSQGVSTPSQTDNTQPTPAEPATAPKGEPDNDAVVTDPWTDEQETALLKGIIRWKPVGLHKHFRMLAISDYLKSQGYAPATAQHMRIPGIWQKMRTLYNLEALDEREDPFSAEAVEDRESSGEPYCPFELPEDEYGEMMFERRLAPDGSTSPSGSVRDTSARPSTVGDTDEPRSSPGPPRGGGRGGRKTRSSRGGRSSRLQVEIESSKSRSSGKPSPANEDDNIEDGDGGDGDGTDAGKDESDAESTAPRSTRTQTARAKSGRGRPAGKRGGRRR